MPKINKEEYEVLKELDDKWKWIARDDNYSGFIFCFQKKPRKGIRGVGWGPDTTQYKYLGEYDLLFQFIQWEDSEPYNIAELIEEYEEYLRTPVAPKFSVNGVEHLFENEGEETEVKKDKQWLRDRYESMETIKVTTKNSRGKRSTSYLKKKTVINLLNQLDEPVLTDDLLEDAQEVLLQTKVFQHEGNWYKVVSATDEPEVLSQEWIDEHEEQEEMYGTYGVPVRKLQNLLVPKQEEPTHAQVQKYYAKIKGHELLNDSEEGYWNVDGKELHTDNDWHDYSGYKTTILTKDEWENLGINDDNADFVKVEELEE